MQYICHLQRRFILSSASLTCSMFEGDYSRTFLWRFHEFKYFVTNWDLNPWPSGSCLQALTWPSVHRSASLQSITFHLLAAYTLFLKQKQLHIQNAWNHISDQNSISRPPSTTSSSHSERNGCCPWLHWVLDNSKRLCYLTRCNSPLRPCWTDSQTFPLRGGCVAQRNNSCFPPSSPGFWIGLLLLFTT